MSFPQFLRSLFSFSSNSSRTKNFVKESWPISETPRQGMHNLNRFQVAMKRVYKSPNFRPYFDLRHPYGFYHNRPIIGENTRIGGGVYLSAAPAEALVVDEKYELLRPILSSFRSRLGGLKSFSVERELSILEDIFELANEVLEWSPQKVRRFNDQHGIGVDTKVALDFYIEQKFGVARHKVLLAAYIIEKLKEDGHLSGNFIIPETIRHADADDEYLVYTFPNGVFATLDPNPSDLDKVETPPLRSKVA